MHFLLKKIAVLSALAVSTVVASLYATPSKANNLLYISPNDYNYSVHLLHPYYDYWFTQGPIVEPIAFAALKVKVGELTMCASNETADTVIRIKPSLFYNPQLRVYHSRLVATVYSGSGNMLATYTGEARQQGFNSVDHGIEQHLNKVYELAMQDLMTKLDVSQLPRSEKSEAKLPCGLIGAQAEPKINFY